MESALEEYRTEVGNTAPIHASQRTCRMHAGSFVAFVHCFRVQRRRGLRHNMLAFMGIVIVVYAVAVVIGV